MRTTTRLRHSLFPAFSGKDLECTLLAGEEVSERTLLSPEDICQVLSKLLPGATILDHVVPFVKVAEMDAEQGLHRPFIMIQRVSEVSFVRVMLDQTNKVHIFDPLHRAEQDVNAKLDAWKKRFPACEITLQTPVGDEEQDVNDLWSNAYRIIKKTLTDNGVNNAITNAANLIELRNAVVAVMKDIIAEALRTETPSVPATSPAVPAAVINPSSVMEPVSEDEDEETHGATAPTSVLGSDDESGSESEEELDSDEDDARNEASLSAITPPPAVQAEPAINLLTPAIFNTVKAKLQTLGWTVPELPAAPVTSVQATKLTETIKIEARKLVTQSSDVETFKAMLEAYKAAYENKAPRVKIDSETLRAAWEAAYLAVYSATDVPANFIQLTVVVAAPVVAPRMGR